ncbi:glycosyl transferase [Flavobacterium sp. GA093]|uniref:Glycosyl transferase n=1 Tax=Flavobacterium hydrocarbonoxydans TaxID=2683249 RepID=A0A6I4NNH1_9FLAO|nr:glycosyltransferase family 10 [Flavobacterium hydrocarbonoxydans]MWB94512.1 glycosyl transferase [Flavobacterium hydrocarbonoxydans]
MNPIKLYKASSFRYTPFDDYQPGDLDYLKKNNISIVTDIKEADVIISQNFKFLKKHFWRVIFGNKFLVWTLEPRFDTHFVSKEKYLLGLVKCHFMNIYTRDVFVTNISIHCRKINRILEFLPDDFLLESNKIGTLMSYYKGIEASPLICNNENIDLIALRSEIALAGNKAMVMDVYGKGWPKGISKEDSRDGDWVGSKDKILNKYNFNLCFENTASFNYMTEKIWDSIQNYCLPIYYAKNTNAYEIFPEDSFIDYADFNSPNELFDFVNNMKSEEFVIRMNKCIQVYNAISEKGISLVNSEREKTLNKIVLKLHSIKKT